MRQLKYILAALMLLCALCTCALAEDGATVITTAEELAAMEFDGNYVLGNDIHLTEPWTPMYFKGSLDGAGHKITGMNINCTTEFNVGMFSWLEGTVSNLTIENASVTGSYSDGCKVSILGTCDGAWSFDPESSAAHIFNCHVSGKIEVSGSGFLGGSGLIGAENSTADVDITVDGSDFMSPGLWGCRNCEIEGTMTINDQGGGSVGASAIMNCSGCKSELDITVNSDDPENENVFVFGILGDGGVRSSNCVNNGDITSPAHAGPISSSDDCESTGKIVSDRIVGMYDCTGCILSGEMSNSGKKACAEVTFIGDTDAHENASNESTASYVFTEAEATTELVYFNTLMPGDVLRGSIRINAGAANVIISEHFEKPEDYEKHVYNHGNLNVTTTTGNINIFRNTATTGSITCVSDTGDIEITGGLYNSGSISAKSGGYIHAVGANLYNSGSVSIYCYGESTGTAVGAHGEGALNVGSVTANGNSSKDVGAVGAGGTGSTNNGPVSSSNSGKGQAAATGVVGENCLNTGTVSASNSYTYYHSSGNTSADDQAFASACGASGNGSFNTGTVTASGSCYCVHAFGNSNGASSNGEVKATGSWIANADGGDGPATASGGQYASATGVQPSASNGEGCTASNATTSCWYFESHHSRCILSHAPHATGGDPNEDCIAIDDKGNTYVCGRANYDLGAETTLESASGGTQPDAAEESMPEEDEPERKGKVEIALYGEKSEDYAIPQFTYAWGSFGFLNADSNDYTHMYAKITVTNNCVEDQDFKLTLRLPDGFSAQPWSVQQTIDVSCSIGAMGTATEWVDIYPLYRDQFPGSVSFSVSGDLRTTKSVPVYKVDDEGKVLCRPTGFVNPNEYAPIPVQVEIDCAKDMIENSVSRYNDNLALLTCALSQAIYTNDFYERTMENLGFTWYKFYESSGSHDVASAYAMKKVVSNGVVYPVILATVRGTVGLEWIGNFNVGYDTAMHQDFTSAAGKTLGRFNEYCAEMNFPAENARAIFSSHSRAAAATNVLAADLNDGSKYIKDLTAYCYATPNSTKSPRADANIFNIVYVDDLVAYVPQNYFKNGVTFVVGELNADAPSSVAGYFNKYCSRSYMNPRNTREINGLIALGNILNDIATSNQVWLGTFMAGTGGDSPVAQAHGAENYLAWVQGNGISGGKSYEQILLARNENVEIVETKTQAALEDTALKPYSPLLYYQCVTNKDYAGSTLAGVFCPVDVTVRDANGNVVAKIVDNEIVEAADSCMFAAAVDEHHLFGLDVSEDYTFDITGTGSGTMRIEMVTVDENIERVSYVSFIDIPVAQGETYDLEMPSGSDSESWKVVSGSGMVFYPGAAPAELPRVYLPAAMTVLDDEAFLNASSMTGMLVCPDTMTTIGASAFSGSGFQAVLVPAGVTDISDTAFEGCNAVIHCYEGSPIHAYAVEKGLAFTLIS